VATFGAVAATSSALLGLLKAAANGDPEFGTAEFPLLRSDDLQKTPPDRLAVSLYLYHVSVNPNRRAVPGRWELDGMRRNPALPLDLHYLMTAWAKDAGTQQRLLGWAARIVHDNATLPAGLLNAFGPDPVFRPDETVEVVWETLTQQDAYDIWDVARPNQQPSAAYVARIVEIDSAVDATDGPLVQTRTFQAGGVPT
jgi:hypothetical protein